MLATVGRALDAAVKRWRDSLFKTSATAKFEFFSTSVDWQISSLFQISKFLNNQQS